MADSVDNPGQIGTLLHRMADSVEKEQITGNLDAETL
jgi:hypothetical protein